MMKKLAMLMVLCIVVMALALVFLPKQKTNYGIMLDAEDGWYVVDGVCPRLTGISKDMENLLVGKKFNSEDKDESLYLLPGSNEFIPTGSLVIVRQGKITTVVNVDDSGQML